MRVLGIDYGERKIGIALGDTETRIASPWMILENKGHGESIKQIKLICEREQVDRVVIGIPYDLRDLSQETEQAQAVRRFMMDMRHFIGVPVDEADESLTSAEAKHHLQAMQSKADDDSIAAAILLQSYLDAIK